MGNFNEKSNAIKKAEIILEQCREREIISKNKIRESIIKNDLKESNCEKRIKRIYEKQRKKVKFWRRVSICLSFLLIISFII